MGGERGNIQRIGEDRRRILEGKEAYMRRKERQRKIYSSEGKKERPDHAVVL